MIHWQRPARLLIAVFAVAFAIVVAFAFRRHPVSVAAPVPLPRMDPTAVVESTAGHLSRVKLSREDLSIDFEKQLTYADGTTKLLGVKVTTTNRGDGRTFTVTAKEGQVHDNPTGYTVTGDVKLAASDGLTATTEHATYEESDGTVRAPGPVQFARGRMTGTGLGMTYDKARDVLTILDHAAVHVAPNEKGVGAANATSAVATFARHERYVRFERDVAIVRAGETIRADLVTAYLTEDEKRIDAVELRGNSRVNGVKPSVGGLKAMTGRDINLKYAPDGEVLQHLLIVGGATIQIAGEAGKPGRQLSAEAIDSFLAADGTTPTALAGRDNVGLAFPAEGTTAARTIRAASIDAIGQQGKGLTAAHFAGNVEYREVGGALERTAKAAALDVGLKPAMSSIDEAKFTGTVHFTEGGMSAVAAVANYVLDKGLLDLSGSDAGAPVPHVLNDQIAIDATSIAVTLAGPKMKAIGNVKSVLQPPKKTEAKAGEARAEKTETKMPALLKQDQATNITADDLDYDGATSYGTYKGTAQLWQADTTIRADAIYIDDKNGNLAAVGNAATSVLLEQVKKALVKGQPPTRERVRSVGTANSFIYEDGPHRATYTGTAHLTGPEGDMTADKIELYLKPMGDEVDHVEAYDKVTLRESARKTTGNRVTYIAEEERYIVTGTPVTVVDECNYETAGRTLTFNKAANTILVDGGRQFRTYTKGNGTCPGS